MMFKHNGVNHSIKNIELKSHIALLQSAMQIIYDDKNLSDFDKLYKLLITRDQLHKFTNKLNKFEFKKGA